MLTQPDSSTVVTLKDRRTRRPGLLALVLVAKYCHHLPLYRQSEIYEHEGIELDRSTSADWVGGVSRTLEPLVEAIRRYILGATKRHGDDIPIPVLAPGNGKTKMGRLWTYVRDDRPAGSTDAPAVWFAYSPDRKSEHPANHLSQFRGTLQADGFAGLPIAKEALERIAALYAIEKEIRGRPPDQRHCGSPYQSYRGTSALERIRITLH